MFKEKYKKELDQIKVSEDFKRISAQRMREAGLDALEGYDIEQPQEKNQKKSSTHIYHLPIDRKKWSIAGMGTAVAAVLLIVIIGVNRIKPMENTDIGPPAAVIMDGNPSEEPVKTMEPPFQNYLPKEFKEEVEMQTPIPSEADTKEQVTVSLIENLEETLTKYGAWQFAPFTPKSVTAEGMEYLVFEEETLGLFISYQNEFDLEDNRTGAVRIQSGGKERSYFWNYGNTGAKERITPMDLLPYAGDFAGTGERMLAFDLRNTELHLVNADTLEEYVIEDYGTQISNALTARLTKINQNENKINISVYQGEKSYALSFHCPQDLDWEEGRELSITVGRPVISKIAGNESFGTSGAEIELILSVVAEDKIVLGNAKASLIWKDSSFGLGTIEFTSNSQIAAPGEPSPAPEETGIGESDLYLTAYLSNYIDNDNGNDTIEVDRLEWLSREDTARLEELGLKPEADFFVYNEEELYEEYLISPNAEYSILAESGDSILCTKHDFIKRMKKAEGTGAFEMIVRAGEIIVLSELYMP